MTAHVVSLVNQKGGVGKTTTAVSLAVALAARGQRVLLVDLDPQANATSAVGVEAAERPGVYEAIMEESSPEDCVVEVPEERISVMPSSPALAGAEVELVPAIARERRLTTALEPLLDRYDWILIDCPPSLGLLTLNALTASRSVIIPVQCEYLALEGLSRLSETLNIVRRALNPSLSVLGVVLTMYDRRTRLAQQVVEEVRRHFSQTFQAIVPRSVRLGEAPSHGESIFRYDPTGRAAAAYSSLAHELLNRMGVPA
jgi:chromosome partitioning protein